LVVDAGGRGIQITLDAVLTAGLEHMGIDQNVIASDVGEGRSDIADSAHIGSQIVNLIHSSAGGEPAVLRPAEIQDLERIARGTFVFRILDVHPSDPMPVGFETLHQVVPNEASGAGYQYSFL